MKKALKNEKGYSTIFHITLLTTFALSFNEIWKIYLFQQKLPIKVAGFATFGVFICFGLISAILSIMGGEKSKKEMKKIIYKESRKLAGILSEYSSEVTTIKVQLKKLTGIMRPEGFHELATVEGLLASLEGRLKKVNQYSKSRDINEVHYAYTNLLEDLSSNNDTMNAVMLSEAIKPIAIKNLKSELDQRIRKIKKHIPYQRSYKVAA